MNSPLTNRLLEEVGVEPVLLDIGAAGAPPALWQPIAPRSVYVGFDPDLREPQTGARGGFHRASVLNSAVTAGSGAATVEFYLTRYPSSSSTLRPNTGALANYLFADLFTVTGTTRVPALTLEAALRQLQLDRVDWIKIDSQGTDLRLFQSLPPRVRDRVLAVDIEPGLIDAYEGEDLFAEAHQCLTRQGFWLTSLKITDTTRARPSTLEAIAKGNPDLPAPALRQYLKRCPAYCEARYLRTIEWLQHQPADRPTHVLLWAIAVLDDQLGFAAELAGHYEQTFGTDPVATALRQESVNLIRRWIKRKRWAWIKPLLPTTLRRLVARVRR